MKTSEDVMAIR